jgi:hypothetical protein
MERDVLRVCEVCGHHWIAQPGRPVPKLIGKGFTRRQQDLARQAEYQRDLRAYDNFRRCPTCNSSHVHTAGRREQKRILAGVTARLTQLGG